MTRIVNTDPQTHIAIIEDAPDYREILSMAIELQPDMKLVGAFGNVESYLREEWDKPPDIILMDIQLPGISGIEGVWKVRELYPGTEAIMCTVFEDDARIFQSLQAGAVGYLLKSSTVEDIINAIHEVVSGGAPMTPKIARRVLGSFKGTGERHQADLHEELSGREKDLLRLLAEGLSYTQVAARLFISLGTVQTHVKSIYRKLQVHSKAEIVAMFAGQGNRYR